MLKSQTKNRQNPDRLFIKLIFFIVVFFLTNIAVAEESSTEVGNAPVSAKKSTQTFGHEFFEIGFNLHYSLRYERALIYDEMTSPYDFVTVAGILGGGLDFIYAFRSNANIHFNLNYSAFHFVNFAGFDYDLTESRQDFFSLKSLVFFAMDTYHRFSLGIGLNLFYASSLRYEEKTVENSSSFSALLATSIMWRIPNRYYTGKICHRFGACQSFYIQGNIEYNLTPQNLSPFEYLDMRFSVAVGYLFRG